MQVFGGPCVCIVLIVILQELSKNTCIMTQWTQKPYTHRIWCGQNDTTGIDLLCSCTVLQLEWIDSPLENPSFCVTVRAILDVVASLYRYTSSSLYQSTWLRLNCRLWMAVRWWGEGHVDNIKEHSLHSLTWLYSNTPHSSQSKWHKTTGSSAFQCTDMSGFLWGSDLRCFKSATALNDSD